MTSIVELFPKSRKLAYDVRQRLSQVQNKIISPSELQISLDELNRQLDMLESLVHRDLPRGKCGDEKYSSQVKLLRLFSARESITIGR